MELTMIGISYKTAPLIIREKSAFSDTECISFYNQLLSYAITQAVVVSTCNRSELYFFNDDHKQCEQALALYVAHCGDEIYDHIVKKQGEEAVLHLFEVCGGYHSMIPGEDQIMHQMKTSYELACNCGSCGKEMHKLFQSCFAITRHIKAKYSVEEHPVSIAYLAMQLLKQHTTLHDKTMMIIGSGEMAELMRVYAQEENVKTLYLCNRTMSHLKQTKDVELIPFHRRYEVLKHCDIICCATASPHQIIMRDELPIYHRPLYILDFALPRDVDASFKYVDQVFLWDMDDLNKCVDEHVKERKKRLQDAYPEILQEAKRMAHWIEDHEVDQLMQSLQMRSEKMAQQTYELLDRKLSLSSHEKYVLNKVLHASFLRMVQEPMMQLRTMKKTERESYMDMLSMLYKGDIES